MPPFPGFIGPSYTAQSVRVESQRLVNCFLEKVESGQGKNPAAIYSRPGRTAFAVGMRGPMRALFWQDGRLFAVGGDHFYEISGAGVATNYGALAIDGNLATIASNGDNGHQLLITSGGFGYIFDLNANTLTLITAASFPAQVTAVVYLDGYFILLARNTNEIALSSLLDGLTYSGLDVAQRVRASDRMAMIIEDHSAIWLFGSEATEVWSDTGASNFPFESLQGGYSETGALPWTVCRADNTLFWVSASKRGGGMVYRAKGYEPSRISNHALEAAMASYATIADAEGFCEEWQGHVLYILNFPTAQKTWCYDAAWPPEQGWTERDWWNAATGQYEADRPRVHVFGFGQHLVGDRVDGTIYSESRTVYTDAGVPIHRRRRAPHLMSEKKRTFYHSFELDVQVGDGIAGAPAQQPLITLRYSNDGGMTWGADRTAQAGLVGEYGTRAKWSQLGSGRDRVFEVEITDAIPVVMAGAFVDFHQGLV